ncbi:type III toxin-antitoxin system ToxN/AbiQ family toxin [Xylocopilactobacillus apicola]|uniref:type III toxin-antitoxin system ToxN/AbiQ family toxin n=1 Tax=Xylocopilactobacillus apicola TaxID=2932184 RepID=UPI003CE49A2A
MLNEYIFLSDPSVNQRIINKAETVYRKKTIDKDDYYDLFCNDFKLLERELANFKR